MCLYTSNVTWLTFRRYLAFNFLSLHYDIKEAIKYFIQIKDIAKMLHTTETDYQTEVSLTQPSSTKGTIKPYIKPKITESYDEI